MDPIRAAAPMPPISTSPVTPVRPVAEPVRNEAPASRTLDPAVSVEVTPEAADAKQPERRAYTRDADSQSLVFRVTDPQTGDVVMQIPDEVILKARAYARESAPSPGERVARKA